MLNRTTPIRVLITYPTVPVVAFGLKALLSDVFDFDVELLGDSQGRWHPRSADVVVSEYSKDPYLGGSPRPDGTACGRLLVIATEEREHEIRAALQRGATGFVLLNSGATELAEAIRAVHRGRAYFSTAVARCLAETFTRESLTRRECEVLQLLTEGAGNKQIASQLNIAVGTVKVHVRSLMDKLEASNRTQAARIASCRGLVEERAAMG